MLSGAAMSTEPPDAPLTWSLIPPPHPYFVQGTKEGGFFEVDEYVVYNSSQQRLRYMVQFVDAAPQQQQQQQLDVPSTPSHSILTPRSTPLEPAPKPHVISGLRCNYSAKKLAAAAAALDRAGCTVAPRKSAPATAKRVGLVTKSGQPMPLQAVQVRAQMLDLVAKVVVLQQYMNCGAEMVESKFVFPLDEHAAVCGFEVSQPRAVSSKIFLILGGFLECPAPDTDYIYQELHLFVVAQCLIRHEISLHASPPSLAHSVLARHDRRSSTESMW